MEAPVGEPLQWYSQVQAVGDFKGNKLLPDIHHDLLVQNISSHMLGDIRQNQSKILSILNMSGGSTHIFPTLLLFVSNSELL